MEYAEIRARMDSEDERIAPLFEDRILGKMEIEELMDKYGLSRRRVFQLLKRAKEIGQEA